MYYHIIQYFEQFIASLTKALPYLDVLGRGASHKKEKIKMLE